VRRLLHVLLVFVLSVSFGGCGSKFFVSGALNSSTISGTVSIVQLTTVVNGGSLLTVTLVTFLQQGTSSTMNFCGDQRTQFPVDQFVQVNFTPGTRCASVIQIVVLTG
jgi:hypothetical protein